MPELPDLENFCVNLPPLITNKKLYGVDLFRPGKVTFPNGNPADKEKVESELTGKTLQSIVRDGKELLFRFDGGKLMAVHLMLHGSISVMKSAEEIDELKYKIFSFNFGKEAVVFADQSGQCNLRLNPRPGGAPDALSAELTQEAFQKLLRTRAHGRIKKFLTDQSIIKGIGNAYADEILWAAKISPHSNPGKLPPETASLLYSCTREVLLDAIEQIKKISPGAITGEERSFLKIHNKDLTETETGAKIIVEQIDQRTTYYTNEQILYI